MNPQMAVAARSGLCATSANAAFRIYAESRRMSAIWLKSGCGNGSQQGCGSDEWRGASFTSDGFDGATQRALSPNRKSD